MGRQSSRVFWNSKDHKDVFWGKYTKAVYIGSQLIWEKLEDLSKYIWEVVHTGYSETSLPIQKWTSVSNDVYVAAIFRRTERNSESRSNGYYIGKWIPDNRQLKLVKKISSIYNRLESMYATEYGLIVDYYQSKSAKTILSIIRYDIENDSEIKKIENGDIAKETTIYRKLSNEICILCSDGIIQLSHGGLNVVGDPIIVKKDFDGNTIETRTFKTGFKAISTNVMLLNGKYVTIGCTTQTVKNGNGYEIIEYKLSINGEDSFEDWMDYYYANMNYSCIVNDTIYWVMRYRYSTDTGKLHYESSNYFIYSCDGVSIQKLKDLGNIQCSKICYVAGNFLCFTTDLFDKSYECFWIGKTVESMEKIEYKNPNSNLFNRFDCPVTDGKYIYIPFYTQQLYGNINPAPVIGEKALKLDLRSYEIIEEVKIEIVNNFEN